MKSRQRSPFSVRPVFRWLLLFLLIQWGSSAPPQPDPGRIAPKNSLLEAQQAAASWPLPPKMDAGLLRLRPVIPESRPDSTGDAQTVAVMLPDPPLEPAPDGSIDLPLSEAAPGTVASALKPDSPAPAGIFRNPAISDTGENSTFHAIILEASERHEVHPALVKAIIMAESSFNVKAISGTGAKGLMQLMPQTASALGVNDVFDPKENIEGGVSYFRKLLDMFEGDIKLALAAYNAGQNRVRKYKGVPPFPETRDYIRKVVRYYEHYSGTGWSSPVKTGYVYEGPPGPETGDQS